ncbi:hypothetical protein [Sphingobium ummariense]
MRTVIVLAAALTLIACDGGSDQAAMPRNQAAPDTGAAAEVARLDPSIRDEVFAKAIRDSGAACPTVTQSQRAEIRTGVRGWKAQCDNGSAHLIEITPDGTAKVSSRTY